MHLAPRPVGNLRGAAEHAPAEASRARSAPVVRRSARAGIGARGAIYALLAYMTAVIALTHRSPGPASGLGALQVLAKEPGGRALVGLLALGLAAYAAWRVLQAISRDEPSRPHGQPDGAGDEGAHAGARGRRAGEEAERAARWALELRSPFERIGWAVIAAIYIDLCAHAVSIALGSGTRGGGTSSHPRPLVATVLRWPAGPGWLGIAGTGLVVAGVSLAAWGFLHDYSGTFGGHGAKRGELGAAHVLGAAGDLTRGILVALVGVYILTAAFTDNPAHAKGLGSALYSFDRLSAGPALLLLAAAGLACFAAYSFLEALRRRM